MWNCVDLILTSTLLWLYLQAAWILLVNFLYLTVPWLIWGAIIIHLLIKFAARIPPPNDNIVKKVLGADPLSFVQKEDDIFKIGEKQQQTNDDQQYCMRVIAHRGAGLDFPENSMSAFRNSHEKGCDGIEFDLALTKDNIPIIFHDVTIDRLTGFNGTIKDMTWDELKDYDISTNHPLKPKFEPNGERIALFENVLQETLQNGQRMFIDIKAKGNEVVKVVLDAFKKHPELYEKAVISSFNPVTIYMIRRKDPKIVAGVAWRPQFFSTTTYNGIDGPREPRFNNLFKQILAGLADVVHDWALERITYYVLGLSFILLHKDVISPHICWNTSMEVPTVRSLDCGIKEESEFLLGQSIYHLRKYTLQEISKFHI
ncbi:glycerophosphodiester phosphodiesterase 1 isoform X2 [Nasonia vitripennis]|uniref:GP-PDE domain-containing protein n=1 Tax=Nasonia vitripennis TaxID=7425 RepID=A0A7M7PYZ9_NASVI|nr:glycerophosphodiester phosphodiesterase 1 isoform X2 [Nasonia vitripennis]